MTTTNKPNIWFWIIAVIALLWNLMGVFQFYASTMMKDSLAENYGETEMEIFNALPSWYFIVFGVAVIAGALASILMLARKKFAVPVFGISLIAVLIQMGYWLFATNIMDELGAQAAIMPMVVIVGAIFLYFYSKGASQKGWLS
ncbi:MAG: hypothetical protein KJO23_00950 [Bacteroidia bacterium]|nr:hypothetical protein [Bacteroidia bacterium]NNM24147.1 hypothetical protein [Flavobacteriaceae bacterium]